jgi:acetyltransferase-like isoleucine patch superfamily enzyme
MVSRPKLGAGTTVADGATVGVKYEEESGPPKVGQESTIRAGTIIYDDVVAGNGLQTGHHALIREETILGDDVLVGTQVVMDGASTVGDNVSMQTGVYIPRETKIGNRVFLGPNATLLNDMYPVRSDYELAGPTVDNDVSIGANATVLPNVSIGQGAFVAAGAVVTEDVPQRTLAIGNPAEHHELPQELEGGNDL